jgi:hypothetical protein
MRAVPRKNKGFSGTAASGAHRAVISRRGAIRCANQADNKDDSARRPRVPRGPSIPSPSQLDGAGGWAGRGFTGFPAAARDRLLCGVSTDAR